jgi:hypothetical protein
MRIVLPDNCPPDAKEVALARVAALVSWEKVPIVAGNLSLSMPHQVFFVRTQRIRADIPLRDAVDAGGWRFLVRKGDDVKAAVQVWEDGATWRVSSVKTGSWATRTEDALNVAYGANSDLRDVPAKPTYLWCRATWTAALWFRAEHPDYDRVVPLPYVRKPFLPLKAYSAQEFMDLTLGKVPAEPSFFPPYPSPRPI